MVRSLEAGLEVMAFAQSELARLRALSASDAALARAIDAVPGRYHAGRDLRPFMMLEPTA